MKNLNTEKKQNFNNNYRLFSNSGMCPDGAQNVIKQNHSIMEKHRQK